MSMCFICKQTIVEGPVDVDANGVKTCSKHRWDDEDREPTRPCIVRNWGATCKNGCLIPPNYESYVVRGENVCKKCYQNNPLAFGFAPAPKAPDMVNHPSHYASGKIECIEIIEMLNMSFCLSTALKYLWRCEKKGNKIQDIEKCIWYLNREIENEKKKNA